MCRNSLNLDKVQMRTGDLVKVRGVMPKYLDDHIYHVYNRGAHKMPLFASPDHYRRLLSIFIKYRDRYKVSFLAYCLMPNHYHLILRQEEAGSISGFLKTVFNTFTQTINALTGHSGTLFQGQSQGKAVEDEDYLVHLIRYVHLNPVTAHLVRHPEEWKFSDCGEWMGLKDATLTDLSVRNEYFEDGKGYRNFVEAYREDKDKEIVGRLWPEALEP